MINGVVVGRNAGRGSPIYDISPFLERPFALRTRARSPGRCGPKRSTSSTTPISSATAAPTATAQRPAPVSARPCRSHQPVTRALAAIPASPIFLSRVGLLACPQSRAKLGRAGRRRLLQSGFVKDPLVGPLAAIASGILVSRFVPFHSQSELLAAIAAFLRLGVLALYRGVPRARRRLLLPRPLLAPARSLALLIAPARRPNSMPNGREMVILGGCVVEPPAISGERERFLLELDPRRARAGHALHQATGETLPALRYGQNIELDARVRKPRNFGNPGRLRLRRLPGAPGHLLDRLRRGRHRARSARPLRLAVPESRDGPARRPRSRRIERLYHGDSYQTGMMQAILIGQSFQLQKVWTEQYRSTGTFHALVISGTHVAMLAAFFLFLLRLCFVPESLALLAHRAGGVALRAGHRLAGAVRALRRGPHAVHDRRLFLPRAPPHEPAGGGGARLPGARPRPAVRRQLPAHVPGGGIPGRLRRAR